MRISQNEIETLVLRVTAPVKSTVKAHMWRHAANGQSTVDTRQRGRKSKLGGNTSSQLLALFALRHVYKTFDMYVGLSRAHLSLSIPLQRCHDTGCGLRQREKNHLTETDAATLQTAT
jgi:hypothetical protein